MAKYQIQVHIEIKEYSEMNPESKVVASDRLVHVMDGSLSSKVAFKKGWKDVRDRVSDLIDLAIDNIP